MSRAVSRAISSSSSVGTEPESPARLVRSPVRVISGVLLALARACPAVRMSAYGHAVAEGGYGRGDLQEPVVLGYAFAAGRGTGLEVAAAGTDSQVGDEVVLGLAGPVRDELPVAGLAADGHGLQRLGHGADLVEFDQRGVADAARDGACDDGRVGAEDVVADQLRGAAQTG